MKRFFTLLIGAALAVGQTQAEPKDKDDKGKGRGHERAAVASASSRGVANAARSVSNDSRRAASTVRSATPRVSSNNAQARVSSNDLTRAKVARDTSTQTAIRSAAPQRNYVSRDSSSARVTTTRNDRDWNDRRDGDRNRDWNDRRYYRPPIDTYRNWDRGRVYSWNNHRYHWYGGTWVIYDQPAVVYETGPVAGASVAAEVQSELRRRGYYDGAVDGVIGPRSRDAIARFQDDAGIAVTGRITNSTLSALGIS